MLQTTLSDAPFPEVMEHGLYSLPFDQAEIIEEIQSSEDSSSELGAVPGKQTKKKQKWRRTIWYYTYNDSLLNSLMLRSTQRN